MTEPEIRYVVGTPVYKCKQCGADMNHRLLLSKPPIRVKQCSRCGRIFEEREMQGEVFFV